MVEHLPTVQPTLVVLEATGGLAVPVTGALAEAGLPVVVVHPRHARDVANATGRLAQTDTRDARGLAHVAEAVRPPPRPLPEAHTLSALRTRRRQVVPRRTAERRRRQTAPRPIRAAIQAHSTWVRRRVARTDDDVAAAIHASPLGRAQDEMLQRMPGVGPLRSRTLVAAVPAWRVWNRQEIAAWMGVAPLHRESGTVRGTWAVWGGRGPVRAVRSMRRWAAVRHHPVRKAFDARLRVVGNAPQVALTACLCQRLTMRNAMLQQQTPWHDHDAPHA